MDLKKLFRADFLLVVAVAILLAVIAMSPPLGQLVANEDVDFARLRRDTDQAFGAKKWADAVEGYQDLLEAGRDDGALWFRLGYALHAQGKLNEAIEAHRKAAEFPNVKPTASYNLACAYALQGKQDEALAALKEAIDAGFSSPQPIDQDTDLKSLKEVPEFVALMDKALPPGKRTVYRAFDFWVGEWEVFNPSGTRVGSNKVISRENGFVIVENWTGASGGSGMSLNFFDPAAKKWKQTWVDAAGNVIYYIGEPKDGEMVFEGELISSKGKKSKSRMTFTPMDDGRVHQVIDRSSDGGKTWMTAFDGYYSKKLPGANAEATNEENTEKTSGDKASTPDSE